MLESEIFLKKSYFLKLQDNEGKWQDTSRVRSKEHDYLSSCNDSGNIYWYLWFLIFPYGSIKNHKKVFLMRGNCESITCIVCGSTWCCMPFLHYRRAKLQHRVISRGTDFDARKCSTNKLAVEKTMHTLWWALLKCVFPPAQDPTQKVFRALHRACITKRWSFRAS